MPLRYGDVQRRSRNPIDGADNHLVRETRPTHD